MLNQLQNLEMHFFTGAKALSGTVGNTALSDQSLPGIKIARVTSSAHGLLATSDIFISGLNSSSYISNRVRNIKAVATNTFDIYVPEGYTAATPAGTEVWCAGYTNDNPYYLIGFKLHLSAADASGEPLSLTIDSNNGSAWDTILFRQAAMTGITDLVYFPAIYIPVAGKDILKFAWTNTGAKTWGIELYTARRV